MIQAVGSTDATPHDSAPSAAESREVRVRVLRQDAPGEESYWERFTVPYEANMNVIDQQPLRATLKQS